VVAWQPHDQLLDDALPDYLDGPGQPVAREPPRLRDLLAGAQAGAHHLAAAVSDTGRGQHDYVQNWPRAAEVSSGFTRLVGLASGHLAAILDGWWSAGAVEGRVTVERRLRLGPPQTASGVSWTMTGQIRRLTRWHWVPVVVELWPVYEQWTMMTMTPRVRVFASERYFRSGHRALDRLTADLAAASCGVTSLGPPQPSRRPPAGSPAAGRRRRPAPAPAPACTS
jgi:hypothetical protein